MLFTVSGVFWFCLLKSHPTTIFFSLELIFLVLEYADVFLGITFQLDSLYTFTFYLRGKQIQLLKTEPSRHLVSEEKLKSHLKSVEQLAMHSCFCLWSQMTNQLCKLLVLLLLSMLHGFGWDCVFSWIYHIKRRKRKIN